MVQTSQAKVFKAHAVPQDPCENLINALKLQANQQKDGDSSKQSIVTGLCERSRKDITEGLRIFIEVDDHCALEVRRPKCEEESPEVLIRQGPEELTLRTEEVGSKKMTGAKDAGEEYYDPTREDNIRRRNETR